MPCLRVCVCVCVCVCERERERERERVVCVCFTAARHAAAAMPLLNACVVAGTLKIFIIYTCEIFRMKSSTQMWDQGKRRLCTRFIVDGFWVLGLKV